jgi:hypothetical protein
MLQALYVIEHMTTSDHAAFGDGFITVPRRPYSGNPRCRDDQHGKVVRSRMLREVA